MFHLGSFENSLRSNDGYKKSATKKRKDSQNNQSKASELQHKHKSCTGKAHGHGVQKNKPKPPEPCRVVCLHEKKKKNSNDQCVPKSNESLTDSLYGIDQKVPGSSQENSSYDSNCLSESDNEKLKCIAGDNYKSTVRKLNDCDEVANRVISDVGSVEACVPFAKRKSRSYDSVDACAVGDMNGRVLKIRGPFGSLVNLSDPRDRSPYTSPHAKRKHFDLVKDIDLTDWKRRSSDPGKKKLTRQLSFDDDDDEDELPVIARKEETETKENQSDEKLLEVIDALSKRKKDNKTPEVFESLDVEEFENSKVSNLFEKIFNETKKEEEVKKKDDGAVIEELISSLLVVNPKRRSREVKPPDKPPKIVPRPQDPKKLIKVKKEEVKDVTIRRKDSFKKSEVVDNKWKMSGILKKSAPCSETVDNVKLGPRGLSSQTTDALISKSSIVPQKSPVESTMSIKLTISGKSDLKNVGDKGKIGNRLKKNAEELLPTPKKPPETIIMEKKFINSEQSAPAKVIASPRSSIRRRERISKVLEMESKIVKNENQTLSEKLNSTIEEYLKMTDNLKREKERNKSTAKDKNFEEVKKVSECLEKSPLDDRRREKESVGNLRNTKENEGINLVIGDVPKLTKGSPGKVKKLISSFEGSSPKKNQKEFTLGEVINKPTCCTPLGLYKNIDDFKKVCVRPNRLLGCG